MQLSAMSKPETLDSRPRPFCLRYNSVSIHIHIPWNLVFNGDIGSAIFSSLDTPGPGKNPIRTSKKKNMEMEHYFDISKCYHCVPFSASKTLDISSTIWELWLQLLDCCNVLSTRVPLCPAHQRSLKEWVC